MNLLEHPQTKIWKKILILGAFLIIASFAISCEMGDSDCNDFEIVIVGTDFAEVEIRNYPDSTYVNSQTYDSEFVQTLHFTKISRGKYYISAYCPHSNVKSNLVSKVVNYSGNCESFDLFFDRR